MKNLKLLIFIILILGCHNSKKEFSKNTSDASYQEKIIQKYLIDSAHQYSYNSPFWDYYIDKGLSEDSTIAYLWQQKAMPLLKKGKYELGMIYLDKAVKYDKNKWLPYRAFIKCIFSKTYKEAIEDFEESIRMEGNSYVMDHSYLFYIALSKIQLNEFYEAEKILKEEVKRAENELGKEWVHHLVLFYYGITLYEQQKYKEAIEFFNYSLEQYPKFSEAQYYKALSIYYQSKGREQNKINELIELAKKNFRDGYTINEDNAIYERYPYQLRLSFIQD